MIHVNQKDHWVKNSSPMNKVGACLSTPKTSILGLLFAVIIGFVFSSCNQESPYSAEIGKPIKVEKWQVANQQGNLRASSYKTFNNKTFYRISVSPDNTRMFSLAIDITKHHPSARYTLAVDYSGGGSEVLTESTPIPESGIIKTYTTDPVKLIDIIIQSDSGISGSYGISY